MAELKLSVAPSQDAGLGAELDAGLGAQPGPGRYVGADLGLYVDLDRLAALAGGLRRAASELDAALAGLGDSGVGAGGPLREPAGRVGSGAGPATLDEACRYYAEACRRALRELRDDVADVAAGVADAATGYAEQEHRVCESFHRLGATMPDPVRE